MFVNQLKGNCKVIWTITIGENWRVTFRFLGEDVEIVNGVSRKKLSKIRNERGGITLEMAFKPAVDHWLALQAAYDLWHARQFYANMRVTPVELDAA